MMSVSFRSQNCRVMHGQARDMQTDRQNENEISCRKRTEERDTMLIVIVIYMTVDKKMI